MIDEYDLYDHQRAALRKLSNGKVLWGGVGVGKSRVASAYYKENEAPRHVYVITPAKKRDSFDWQEEFYRIGIGPRAGPSGPGLGIAKGSKSQERISKLSSGSRHAGNESFQGPAGDSPERTSNPAGEIRVLGQVGNDGGIAEAGKYPYVLTVDSWNNLAKYVDVTDAFFIFDEQRLVGSGKWVKAFLKIARRNHWILLSGTPGDTWMDYAPLFVAHSFYKNTTDFKRQHVVYNTFTKFPKIDRYIDVGRLAKQRSQLLVEMPYVRHTRRRQVEVVLPYDKDALDLVLNKRWHVFEDRPLKDVGEMFLVARRVVNSDPSRLDMVVNLWEMHPKLIIFYNFNYELESLRSLAEYYGLSQSSKLGWSNSTLGTSSFSGVSSTSPNPSSSSRTGGKGQDPRTTTPVGTTSLSSSQEYGALDLSGMATGSSAPPAVFTSGNTTDTKRNLLDTPGLLSKTQKTSSLEVARSIPGNLIVSPSIGISEWNGHKHQPIPKTDRWLYFVHYSCGDAWNCTETDAVIKYSQHYSWKTVEQAEGRIDRLNTLFKDLWYYNFVSQSWIDKAIGRAVKAKGTFNEAKYVRMFQ